MSGIDWTDSQSLYQLSEENIKLAAEYAKSRKRFGKAKAWLDLQLAKAYRDKAVDRKLAYEKALIFLTENSKECEDAYKVMTEEEASFKGLEKVIETRASKISLAQSLIKNRITHGG